MAPRDLRLRVHRYRLLRVSCLRCLHVILISGASHNNNKCPPASHLPEAIHPRDPSPGQLARARAGRLPSSGPTSAGGQPEVRTWYRTGSGTM